MAVEEHSLTCPCCGYKTIDGEFQICEVCRWEFDLVQFYYPETTGANPMSLQVAQSNFRQFGWKYAQVRTEFDAMDEPLDRFLKDPNWRPIDGQSPL